MVIHHVHTVPSDRLLRFSLSLLTTWLYFQLRKRSVSRPLPMPDRMSRRFN